MSDLKLIVKEEMAVALENLKAKGKDIGEEALEEIASEISDAFGRIVVRTDGSTDDFFLMIKPMLDKKIDEIHDEDAE